MTWGEFLQYAANPGIAIIVGVVLSVLVVYIPRYEALDPKWKRLVFVGLCFAVPLAATVLAVATSEWGAWGDWKTTWWPALQSGFVSGTSGTVAHTRKL